MEVYTNSGGVQVEGTTVRMVGRPQASGMGCLDFIELLLKGSWMIKVSTVCRSGTQC